MEKTQHQRIYDAAKELFAKDGYKGVSLKRIAKKAGVSSTTIYSYYENKAAIQEEIQKTEDEQS